MKTRTERRRFLTGAGLVLAAAVLWSTIALYVRSLRAAGLETWDITLVRMGVSTLAIGAYLLAFHRERLQVRLRDLWIFVGAGVGSLMLMSYTYSESVQLSSMAVAATLLYTAPAFVMLLSLIFFRERLTGRKLLALGLSLAGCALVSGIAQGQLSLSPAALGLGLCSGLSYALYSIFGRVALNRGYDSWTITFYSFLFATLGALVFAHPGRIVQAATPAQLLSMLLLGLTTGFAAYLLYTKGLTCIEAGRASVLASFELVSGALLGLVVFSETLAADGIAGIVLLLGAVVVLSLPERKVNNS